MDWIAANWVWIVLFGGMLLLHTVGHGHGHGSRHSRHRAGRNDPVVPQGKGVDAAGRGRRRPPRASGWLLNNRGSRSA